MPGDFDFDTDEPKPTRKRERDERDDRRRHDEQDEDQTPRRKNARKVEWDEISDDNPFQNEDEAPRKKTPPAKREEPTSPKKARISDDNPFADDDNHPVGQPTAAPKVEALAADNPFADEPEPPKTARRPRPDANDDDVDRRLRKRNRNRDDHEPRSGYHQRNAKKGSPVVLIVAIALVGLLFIGGAVGAAIYFMSGDKDSKNIAKDKDSSAKTQTKTNISSDKPTEKKDPTPGTVPSKDTIDKVKRNTVYIRVLYRGAKREGGTGSGFVERESKHIITNAHVVGALKPKDPGPAIIELIFNSGDAKEYKMFGELVALDQAADLAIIHPLRDPTVSVTVPEGLTLARKPKLDLLQQLFIFGFPFGESLGKEITASSTTISSIRKDQIQVNGGMNPGNSGGPVVDAKGSVIGVAVAGIKNTNINFAIPADAVYDLIAREKLR